MKVFTSIILGLFFSLHIFSQGTWQMISPNPTLNNLFDACFVTEEKGWIVGENGTILSTSNGGESWEWEHEDESMYFKDVFFIDESEGWVIGWHDVLHTENGGETWEEQDLPGMLDVEALHFINPDTGWIVGTYDMIYKTTNGGSTWEIQQNGGFGSSWLKDVHFTDALHGVAVGHYMSSLECCILVTEDGGENWVDTSPENYYELKAIEFISSDTAWVVGHDQNVIRTTDGGYTWETKLNSYNLKDDIHFFDSNHGIILADNKMLITYNGGINWNVVYTQYSYYTALSFFGQVGYVVGYDGRMIKSSDYGENWENLSSPIFGPFEDIYFSNTLNGWAKEVVGPNLARTTNGGGLWETVDIGSSENLGGLWFISPEVGYAVGEHYSFFKTVNGGDSWQESNLGIEDANVNSIFFIDELNGFICGGYGFFYKTNDGGLTWNDVGLPGYVNYKDIHFSDENNGWIINYSGYVYHTNDGGNTWEQSGLSGVSGLDDIFFLDNEKGFITSLDGLIMMTDDAGISWQEVGSFSENSNRARIAFANENEGWLIANSKLHYTIDGGLSWNYHSHQGYMSDIYFLNPTKGLISGSNSLILKYHNTNTTIDASFYNNFAVFPNPTTNLITISIPKVDINNAMLSIYDIHGKLFRLIDISKIKRSLNIDVSSLSEGLYLVVIKSPDYSYSTKFLKR